MRETEPDSHEIVTAPRKWFGSLSRVKIGETVQDIENSLSFKNKTVFSHNIFVYKHMVYFEFTIKIKKSKKKICRRDFLDPNLPAVSKTIWHIPLYVYADKYGS